MFGLIKQVFIVLLANIVNTSSQIKCIYLKSKQCKIQAPLLNLQLSLQSTLVCVNLISKIKRL